MDAHWGPDHDAPVEERWWVEERILAAVAEEREHIAAELHDGIGGTLTGVALGLAALRRAAPDAESRERLAKLGQAVDQGIAEIRTLSFGLQFPWCEPGTSFESAVVQYVNGFADRTGLEVHLDVEPRSGILAAREALALIRVLQEALLNVHRHAQARSVRVSYTSDGKTATLAVQDDGRGMTLIGGAPPAGAGLLAMRHRIGCFGGVLRIESGPAGTTLSACMPLELGAESAQRDAPHDAAPPSRFGIPPGSAFAGAETRAGRQRELSH